MRGWRLAMAVVLFAAGVGAGLVPDASRRMTVTPARVVSRSHQPPPIRVLLGRNGPVLALAASGLFLLGLPSIATLARIGYESGRLSMDVRDLPLPLALASTLPHGLPELAAFLLAGAAGLTGLSLGVSFALGNHHSMRSDARQACRWLLMAVLLLFGAACVERWITPVLIRTAGSMTAW